MSFSKRAAIAAIAITISAIPALTAGAQSPTFNIAGGLSLANSDFGDRNDAGYSLIVGIGLRQPNSPLSFRTEGIYTEYDRKLAGGKSHAGGILGSAVYDLMLN